MIQWIKYDRHDRSIQSHVPHLVTDGTNTRIAFRAASPDGYMWFKEQPRSPIDEKIGLEVTHWSPINLPGEDKADEEE